MKTLRIGQRTITETGPTFIIAEACENHMGDMELAREMVRLARLAGADAIKFQHHLAAEEMLPDVPMAMESGEPLYKYLERTCFPIDKQAELKSLCEKEGIEYLCTPFSLKAAIELNEIGVRAFKIGSGEVTDIPTLLRIAEWGKPMLISTGMATFEEIDETYRALLKAKAPFAFFNCVSEYPPRYEDVNLGVIHQMQQKYSEVLIGHSDHTPDNYTSYAAVALGACFVEKHIVTDKKLRAPDVAVSIDMWDLYDLVQGIRKIDVACGDKKYIHPKEKPVRDWAARSVVSLKEIPKGVKITAEMVWSKRPGNGIPSKDMSKVIGRVATRNIPANTLLAWADLEG